MLSVYVRSVSPSMPFDGGAPGVTAMVPFLRQLSDHVDDATSSAVTAPGTAAAAGPGGGEPGVSGVGGPAAADGLERVRLDAERQILLTMLLAHMCSEHDATPRTFVEQVRVAYYTSWCMSYIFLSAQAGINSFFTEVQQAVHSFLRY